MKRLYLAGILLLLVLAVPIILWQLQPSKPLKIAIIDKTVPDKTYREHLGITWLLNHLKYQNADNKPFNPATDYYGSGPGGGKDGKSRPLPADFDAFDVIYLADTYGVYDDDLNSRKQRAGARSEKITGGLQQKEWQAIAKRLDSQKKSLLIAEFNTFASPTDAGVRQSVTDYLGIDWSGWSGRYFSELDAKENAEIPKWVLEKYPEKWPYKGPGFILVHDEDNKVVVLENKKHVNGRIQAKFTKAGEAKFGLERSPDYQYWFDLVTPKTGTSVLANYEWNLTGEGKAMLKKYDIPEQFAAVLSSAQGASSSYYFAGDFNDMTDVPRYYQIKGLSALYGLAHKYSEQSFYWSAYIPMMRTILDEFERVEEKPREAASKSSQYNARVKENAFEVLQDGKWTPLTIKGVNIGMGKPGAFPGEAAITEAEYYKWFQQIGSMNANTIRIYTLHPPGFYNALKRYNEAHAEKIYVMHGVWINEMNLVNSLDAFEKKNLKEFQDEMRTIVDVVHGNKIVEAKAGHASGSYRADVSEYVIGWIIGIEWYPFMVEHTNERHASVGEYKGKYFTTKNAKPFEHWLAQQMDLMTDYEMKRYQWIRPMSFTNWVTTDILDHPSDSTGQEDIVGVDPNVIYTKGQAKQTEQFASYHIYPYYPDFLNFDEKYRNFKDHRGKRNNYAGYLRELNQVHRLPILVAEFGVPSSRGLTHENPFGWNQGFLSETEQGDILRRLFEDIMEEKMLGGLVFTWQDEWFKRTWNTMEQDNPDRRPFWSNAQTNEQQFGLLSFDRNKIKIDGSRSDWKTAPLYKKEAGKLKGLYADHDERYLYIRVDYDTKSKERPILLLDVLPDQGNRKLNDYDLKLSNGADFLVDLNKKQARMLVDPYYDFYTYRYGYDLKMIQLKGGPPAKNSGRFIKMNYALNKEYYLPDREITLPFSFYETGKLREGNGNPASPGYDSLADYHVSDGMIELRIPWLLLQAKDPSRREFVGDLYENGMDASKFIEQIHMGAVFPDEKGRITDSLPEIRDQKLGSLKGYTWEHWKMPEYEPRLKKSYEKVQKLFSEYK